MTKYVLCHGAWGGGWGWTRVAAVLRGGGHEVFTPTYTGLGERVHLAAPEVDLRTHIDDVRNVIRYERLDDFVLVGHSYGGMVVTGVADREWEKISRLVYLDAFLPADGQSLNDLTGPERAEMTLRAAREHGDGWLVPRPDGSLHPSLSDEDREWLLANTCMQPLRTFADPLPLAGNHLNIAEKVYVLSTGYSPSVFPQFAEWTRTQSDWQTLELPTHHHLHLSMPAETAGLIQGVDPS